MVNGTPQPLYSRERPGNHCIVGWVGLRAGLDECEKSRPQPGFDPRTVQPVASRCTDSPMPAHHFMAVFGRNVYRNARIIFLLLLFILLYIFLLPPPR